MSDFYESLFSFRKLLSPFLKFYLNIRLHIFERTILLELDEAYFAQIKNKKPQ